MLMTGTTDYVTMIKKLRIINFLKITILIFTIQAITSTNGTTNPVLQKLLNLKQAKQLRNDLYAHIDSVEEMIKHLDEWSINEILDITNNKDLNAEKIDWLKNEINLTKKNVNKLSEDVSNVEDSVNMHGIKLRYNDLYLNIQNLGDYLNSKNLNTFRLFQEYFGNKFPNLYELYNNLMYQIQAIFKLIVIRENILLSSECIKAIRGNDFEQAAVKYGSIKDDATLTNIVKEVYNSTEDNFELIVSFASKLSNVSQSFIAYSALVYEMEINKQNQNGYKITDLIKKLKTEVIYPIKLNLKIKKNALSLEGFLTDKLKIIAKESLKSTLLDEQKYSENIKLFEKVLLLDENIFSDISYIVLLEFYNNAKVKPIYGWIVEAFQKILSEIYKNHLDGIDVFKIAYFINSLLVKSKQSTELTVDVRFGDGNNSLSRILTDSLDYYKRILPESVRNIVFIENVCIINVGLNQYLHSTNNKVDVDKFGVFTSVNDEQLWKITRSYNYIYNIQNYLQNSSYLYTSDENKSDGHNVFTWIQTDDILGIWQIEPFGDDCLIKNVLHNEYLSVSEDLNHWVFTKNIINNNSNYFKWRFINCLL